MKHQFHIKFLINYEKLLQINLYITIIIINISVNGVTKENGEKDILFIMVDGLRHEFGCYGSVVKSPNKDKFAMDGILFLRAFYSVPISGISRACIMSGLRATTTRFVEFDAQIEKDAPGQVTFPQLFKNNRYYTISDGKVIISPSLKENNSCGILTTEDKMN
jgi:iduronate 2-sulfatase